jgi:hypothetical protein
MATLSEVLAGLGQSATSLKTQMQKLVAKVNNKADLGADGKVPSAQLPSLNYIPTSAKATANGVASLGADGRIPEAQLPASLESTLKAINGA